MKYKEISYVFDASAKTVQFLDWTNSLNLEFPLVIFNKVDNIIIYNLADPAKKGVITQDPGGDIITLDYDTTSMSDTDELLIYFENNNSGITEAQGTAIISSLAGLGGLFPDPLGQTTKANSLSVALASDQGAATEAKQDDAITQLTSIAGEDFATQTTLALVKTAVETIDNFISGSRGLVTEDNSAAIKTAVETIDNFISGSRGLVTEDNSAAIKTAVEVIDNFISGSRGLVTEDNSAAIKTSVELLDDAVIVDNAQFTDGTTKLHMKGFIYDEVAGTALTENDAAAARINANRAQVSALEDGATRGRYATVTAANALKVDASGVAVPITDNSGSLTVDAPVGTPVFATITPSATGGWDTFMATSADGSTALTNSAQAIKASAGTFGGYYIYNPNSSAVYVHIYNVASGSVTVGTTNPKNTFCIPATSGANLEITNGIKYDTAMSCSATTTGPGSTAPSTALEANFFFK